MEIALIAEGTSDKVLIPSVRWLCKDINPDKLYEIEPIIFDNISPKPNLSTKVEIVLRQNKHQLILVHRDQDNMSRNQRINEIEESLKSAQQRIYGARELHCVPLIPVRMTEAWLLIDEQAINIAAGNRNNKVALDLPKPRHLEAIADPKDLLYKKIRLASGLSGRKLKKLRPSQTIHSLADIIEDYSPLNELSAFDLLRHDLYRAIGY